MSYALDVAPDARSEWLALGVAYQEAALDEIDRLAAEAESHRGVTELLHDWVVTDPVGRHYMFLRVLLLHEKRVLVVLGVGHHTLA